MSPRRTLSTAGLRPLNWCRLSAATVRSPHATAFVLHSLHELFQGTVSKGKYLRNAIKLHENIVENTNITRCGRLRAGPIHASTCRIPSEGTEMCREANAASSLQFPWRYLSLTNWSLSVYHVLSPSLRMRLTLTVPQIFNMNSSSAL